eukprot:16916-Heterococcus_DN1.PRE.3
MTAQAMQISTAMTSHPHNAALVLRTLTEDTAALLTSRYVSWCWHATVTSSQYNEFACRGAVIHESCKTLSYTRHISQMYLTLSFLLTTTYKYNTQTKYITNIHSTPQSVNTASGAPHYKAINDSYNSIAVNCDLANALY